MLLKKLLNPLLLLIRRQTHSKTLVPQYDTSAVKLYDMAESLCIHDAGYRVPVTRFPPTARGRILPVLQHDHRARPVHQVLAVVAQAVLSNLDRVEIALGTPLGGQRYTWKLKVCI